MDLTPVRDGGLAFVEGRPAVALMRGARDGARVLEACFSAGARATLLYADNLPPAFFDLSSGEAAAVLQQFRNYGVRLAVVLPPGAIRPTSRFAKMAEEERRRPYFGVFDSRPAALAWLRK
jgi:hypothetical protein